MKTTKEVAYTSTGFRDWKHATKHESSTAHVQAMCSWKELLNRDKNQSSIKELLTDTILEKRRYYMTSIIEVIVFLIANEVGFRGNWDEDQHKENGLFRNLFEFKLKDNECLRTCQHAMPRNATYTSPEIQNEIIGIIAIVV